MQDRIRAAHHRRHPELPLRPPGQKGQIARPHYSETHGEYAAGVWMQSCHHDGPAREPDSGVLQCAGGQLVCGAEHPTVDQGELAGERVRNRESRCWWCEARNVDCGRA